MIYRIAVTYRMHTCPADPQPHPYDIGRLVVERVDTGRCLTPVRLPRSGVLVSCRRRVCERYRCANCQTRIEVVEEKEEWE